MLVNDLNVNVKRSNRKTATISVERDGSVFARVPIVLTDDEVSKLIQKHEYKIYKNLAQWKIYNEHYVNREYVSGQSFMYFGRNYRLKVTDEDSTELTFNKGRFWLGKNQVAQAESLFIAFYKAKLVKKVKPIIKLYESKLGVTSNQVRVLDLKNRWGSCSVKGNINLHWKCAMSPYHILHYIVLHELVHLIHFDHSPAFWRQVEIIMPDYKTKVEWLKIHGVGMDL